MSSHCSMLQSKILVSECYLLILLEWSDDVTGYCAHVLPGSVYKLWLQLLLLVCVRKLVLMPPPLNWSEKLPSSSLLSLMAILFTAPPQQTPQNQWHHIHFSPLDVITQHGWSRISKKIINVLIYNKRNY